MGKGPGEQCISLFLHCYCILQALFSRFLKIKSLSLFMNAFFRSDLFQKKTFAEYFRSLLILTVFFSFIVFLTPVSKPVVNIEMISSVSGMSQLFFNDGNGYSEDNSVKGVVNAGKNRLAYPLSIQASPVRWDPLNSPGTIEVLDTDISVLGVSFLSGAMTFKALNQIESINNLSGKTVIRIQENADDPELEMTFAAEQMNRIRIMLSVLCGFVVSAVVLVLFHFARDVKTLLDKLPAWFYVVGLLALLNMYVFYDHLFGQSVFPWDFSLTYHAIPNYWLTSLQAGQFPLWVPFQGMGYPLLMNMQSGLFYPPNYVFYIFNIPYTLHAAVVFQVAHVFFAGLGAYVLLRKSGQDVLASVIGSIAYNLFGGFFCNSEHLDIVRSFAFLPWIFAGLVDLMRNGVKPFSLIVLPVSLLFQWTGGYPGSSISIVFISFVFIFASAIAKECSWKHFIIGAGLMMSGVLMAAPAFFPVLMLKGEIARSAEAGNLAKTFIAPVNLLSLIQRIDFPGLPGDVSMRSLHVLIIPFVFIFFMSVKVLKRNVGMTAVAVCALFMGMGGWFFDAVSKLFPPLGYSRFPSADYRGFIALALIYFAMLGYREYKASPVGVVKDRLVRFALFGVLGYFVVDPLLVNQDAFVFSLVTMLLVIVALCVHRFRLNPAVVFILFFSIQVIDFIRVEDGQAYWDNPSISGVHAEKFGSLQAPAPLLAQRIQGVDSRAERSDEFKGQDFGYQGYLNGIYMVGDYSGPMQFLRQRYIVGNPDLLSFAKKAWAPVYFKGQPDAQEAITAINSGADATSDRVRLTLYKPNQIEYDVKSASGFGFLENETYFPGWTMTVNDGIQVAAKDVHGFRYWEMPAGTYKAVAKFNMPYFRSAVFLAVFGLLVYLMGVGGLLILRKK